MKTQSKQTGYVPVSQKLSYSIASGGGNIITTVVGSFVSAYLTDSVGIGVATVSTMMLINRLFDLFSDFLMGSLVDKTHAFWKSKTMAFTQCSTGCTVFNPAVLCS